METRHEQAADGPRACRAAGCAARVAVRPGRGHGLWGRAGPARAGRSDRRGAGRRRRRARRARGRPAADHTRGAGRAPARRAHPAAVRAVVRRADRRPLPVTARRRGRQRRGDQLPAAAQVAADGPGHPAGPAVAGREPARGRRPGGRAGRGHRVRDLRDGPAAWLDPARRDRLAPAVRHPARAWPGSGPPRGCCAATASSPGRGWGRPAGPSWPSRSGTWPRPGPRPSTPARPRCGGSSGTCTTGRRRGWWRWA